MKILLIDNRDSFVHNLADEFRRHHATVDVYRDHLPLTQALAYIECEKPNALVFSPGPGAPHEAELCLQLLKSAPINLPILGVCLGHQCIIHYFGGEVKKAPMVCHGKPVLIQHENHMLFDHMSLPFQAARYHSLVGTTIPGELNVIATSDNLVMAVAHKTRPIYGVQFHPESILTPEGSYLINNFLRLAHEVKQ